MNPGENKQVTTMVRALLILLAAALLIVPTTAQSSEAELVLEHSTSVRTASWNADETRILTAEGNGSIHVWSAEDGERLLTYHEDGSAVTQAHWVLDDAAILSAEESGTVLLSDVGDGRTIHSWELAGLPLALELNVDETAALGIHAGGRRRDPVARRWRAFAAFRGAGGNRRRGLERG